MYHIFKGHLPNQMGEPFALGNFYKQKTHRKKSLKPRPPPWRDQQARAICAPIPDPRRELVGPGTNGKSYVLKNRQARDLRFFPVFHDDSEGLPCFFFRIESIRRWDLSKWSNQRTSWQHFKPYLLCYIFSTSGRRWDHRSEPTVLQTAQRVFGGAFW